VLETIDRHWAVRQVNPIFSISNILSIENHWDRSSPGLEEYILKKGLSRDKDRKNLTSNFSDFFATTFGEGKKRCGRSRELLAVDQGQITIQSIAAILRNHGSRSDPRRGLHGPDICMHASLGPIRISQTTGSLIALLNPDSPLVFATGTAAPCTGIFKPFWVDVTLDLGKIPTDRYNPETLFWSHERLHREVLINYPERLLVFVDERDALEEEFIAGALALLGADRAERKAFSEDCLSRAAQAKKRWLAGVREISPRKKYFHSLAWKRFNNQARWTQE
jgi:dipeptidase